MQLFPNTKTKREELLPPVVTMENIPLPPPLPGSQDVNLILMVKEHGPKRIDVIDKELQEMETRTARLVAERSTLERLIKAVEVAS